MLTGLIAAASFALPQLPPSQLVAGDVTAVSSEAQASVLQEMFARNHSLHELANTGAGAQYAGAGSSFFLTTNQDPEGDMPRSVAFAADGSAAVIVNRDTDTVTFLDSKHRAETGVVAAHKGNGLGSGALIHNLLRFALHRQAQPLNGSY